MYRPGIVAKSSSLQEPCCICGAKIRDDVPVAILTCLNMSPNLHQLTVHSSCASSYAEEEAHKVVKNGGKLHAICPRLDGLCANTKLVSNTLLKVSF